MRSSIVGSVLLFSACGGGGDVKITQPPPKYVGFHSLAHHANVVWVEATYYTDHKRVFDTNLTSEGILPVALRVGLRGKGQDELPIQITPEDMALCMYLQDGTRLDSVPYAEVGKDDEDVQDAVTRFALKTGLIEVWDKAREGFVFFQIPKGDDFEVDGGRIIHHTPTLSRELDLLKSLITLKIKSLEGLTPIFVGIKQDIKGGR